mgnify:CR=1 FL=1
MPFTANDYEKLHQLMNSSPEIRELLQKLLDSQAIYNQQDQSMKFAIH